VKDKKQIAFYCFFTDVVIAVWSYYKATNYDEYVKAIKNVVNSPDYQVQLYQVILQTMTFSLALFLAFHLIIYFMLIKEKTYAIKYLRFYTFSAALSCVLMLFGKIFIGIIPFFIYGQAFRLLNNSLKEKALQKAAAEKQTQLRTTKQK
jgi:hypothetical protein